MRLLQQEGFRAQFPSAYSFYGGFNESEKRIRPNDLSFFVRARFSVFEGVLAYDNKITTTISVLNRIHPMLQV